MRCQHRPSHPSAWPSSVAAFELSRPEHQGRFEITAYQLGWRLGGKGASGRGPSQRIEEHGLHLWMGFYENAFALMRACHAERHRLHPTPALPTGARPSNRRPTWPWPTAWARMGRPGAPTSHPAAASRTTH